MPPEETIDGVYVVHAKSGYEQQAAHVTKLFAANHLKFEFETSGDPSAFTPELLSRYFVPGILDNMSPGTVSCTLNHMLSYEKIVARQQRFALVFENDPFFLGDFTRQMRRILKEAATLPPGFIVSLENTTLEFPPVLQLKRGKLLYEADHGRCAGAYLIDLQGATKALQWLHQKKCAQVIDWWHNTLIDEGILKMYWADPPLTEQGSHNGLMHSGISTKNKNWKRRLAWQAQRFYKGKIRRWFKLR